ncbi:MAG: hypothetical protein C0462_12245 [Alcanivorax sp.]|nr:hypothetical protein [Alcanivorax sp.]
MAYPPVIRFLLPTLALAISGCGPSVGGPCEYSEPVKALAQVESLDNGHVLARILHIDGPATVGPGDTLMLRQPQAAPVQAGEQHPVMIRSRLTGSCTPFSAHWAPDAVQTD